MWDAVRKIFRHDETPDDTTSRDTAAVPTAPTVPVDPLSGVGTDDGGAFGPMHTARGDVPDRTGATGAAVATTHDGTPSPPPLHIETAQTVPTSPLDDAPQGLAAEGLTAPAIIPGATPGTPGTTEAPSTVPAATQSADSQTAIAGEDGVAAASASFSSPPPPPPPSPSGVDAAGGEAIAPAPVAEPSPPAASPPAASISLPETLPAGGEPVPTPANTGGRGDATAPTSGMAAGSPEPADSLSPVLETEAGAMQGVGGLASVEAQGQVDAAAMQLADDPTTETVSMTAGEATLAPGAMVAGRYRIAEPVEGAGDTRTRAYRAADTRSYERCWSCGSAQNGAANRFCQNCGAPIQNHPVVLVQTATPTGQTGEIEHGGLYLHVRPERRPFGVEGIGIEVGAHSAEGPHHPNEDSYWYTTRTLCANSGRRSTAVALLADGMGGYAPGSGLISSRIAATAGASIAGALDARGDADLSSEEAEAIVRAGIAAANGVALAEIARSGEMGATLVGVVVHGDTAYVANVGDSRAYYVDPQGQATRITRDQSLVAQELGQGGLSEEDLYTAPGNNIVLHAIGEERVETAADWYAQPLEPDSLLVLCSDGYWKTMRGALIPANVLHPGDAGGEGGEGGEGGADGESATLNDVARRMVDDALARGSDDNTTVLLIAIS